MPASRSTSASSGATPSVADVGPVDGQRAQRLGHVGRRVGPAAARSHSTSRAKVVAACSSLASSRNGAELAPLAGQLGVQLGQRRLGRRVDEQRADVVEELIARGPAHRPVLAQLLAGVDDLLDPDALGAAVAQPLQVAERDRRARRGGRCAARRRRVRAPWRASSRRPRWSSCRTPARCRCRRTGGAGPSRGSMSKNARAAPRRPRTGSRRRSPCGSARRRARSASRAARAREALLAAECIADAARVDDVVAVGRALAGLQIGDRYRWRRRARAGRARAPGPARSRGPGPSWSR